MSSVRDQQILFIPEEFQELVEILQDDAQEEISVQCPFGNTIMFNSENGKSELYLRSGIRMIEGRIQPDIEIARIQLHNQRSGVGTKILRWLCEHGKKKGFSGIFVESIQTQAMKSFVEKHGFTFVSDGGWELNEDFHGNWRLSI